MKLRVAKQLRAFVGLQLAPRLLTAEVVAAHRLANGETLPGYLRYLEAAEGKGGFV